MGQGISELKRHTRLHLSVMISTLVLVGCSGQTSYLRDRAGDYTQAQTSPPLKLPKGTEARQLGDILAIPPADQQTLSRDFQVPKPGQRLMVGGNRYVIERSGGQLWLSSTLTPEQAWLSVTAYAKELGAGIASSNPNVGMLTTQWYDFDASNQSSALTSTLGKLIGDDSEEDRFRFHLQPGAQPGITNIYIAHQGRSSDQQSDPEQWNNLTGYSEQINSLVLGDLLVFLASNDAAGNVTAATQVAALVTELGQDGNGNPVLTLRGQNYAQVWDAVAVALHKAGFNVVDRDRSSGLFYLEDSPAEQEPEKSRGFWSGWFGSKKDQTPAEGLHNTLTVRVSSYPDLVQLSVERDVNTSAPAEVSSQLLKLIQEIL